MTLDEMIEVLQAAKAGRQIQYRPKGVKRWRDCKTPVWSFGGGEYRIKPEPIEIWVLANHLPGIGNHTSALVWHGAEKMVGPERWLKFRQVMDHE